jgi:DNA-binding NtrC family response regulator
MEGKTRVLIVDDNTSLAVTMADIFTHMGYDTLTAESGEEALALASKNQDIDVVFMDIKMPVMNGVETYKQMKTVIPDASVIMMTAYAVEELIEEAMTEGAYGVMYKPLQMEGALKMIEDCQNGKEGAFIMVVDDDPSTLETFSTILSRKGYQVVTATNGDEAVSIAKENNFDIIFLDMKLPTINGLETYLQIKEIKPESIAVLITGYQKDMAEVIDETLLSSAYTCLQKPLDMSHVLSLIKELSKRKEDQRAGSAT